LCRADTPRCGPSTLFPFVAPAPPLIRHVPHMFALTQRVCGPETLALETRAASPTRH